MSPCSMTRLLDSGLELTIHLEDEKFASINQLQLPRKRYPAYFWRMLLIPNFGLLYHQQFLAHQLAQELMIRAGVIV